MIEPPKWMTPRQALALTIVFMLVWLVGIMISALGTEALQ